ncbi:MAG: helix-turn-helix domain-containing protein [Eubacteriales bacterium]
MLYLPAKPGYSKLDKKSYINTRSCFYISVSNEMLYRKKFMEYCEMIYVLTGKVYIALGDVEFTIGDGEVIVIPRYQIVNGVRKTETKTQFCTVDFACSDDLIDDICEKTIAVSHNSFYFSELLSHLNTALSIGGDESYISDALMLTLLNEIRSNCGNMSSSAEILEAVTEYIDLNIDKIITVDEIAEHFSYSKDHLIRKFRDSRGYTLKKYINEKKLTMAKHLLTSTEMSIEKVGESIGYDDVDLFIKFFKYHEKVTPQRYRKINM